MEATFLSEALDGLVARWVLELVHAAYIVLVVPESAALTFGRASGLVQGSCLILCAGDASRIKMLDCARPDPCTHPSIATRCRRAPPSLQVGYRIHVTAP